MHQCDRKRIEAHLLRLDSGDRVKRFCGTLTDTNIVSLLGNIDWHHTCILGCFVDRELRGLAHISPLPDRDDEAEIAISVDSAFRREGMATGLTEAAMRWAADNGFTAVSMVMLAENMPMRRLAIKLGFHMSEINNQTFARRAWRPHALESSAVFT